jgi:pimeloyl-ACP methyl ester carboxylesterase
MASTLLGLGGAMSSINLNGARVTYAEMGSGETVLLLHSSANSGAQWRPLMEELQASCRLLAPDLYGYGETDPWPHRTPLRLSDEVALARAVLGRCCSPIHLVGHSYGGAVALSLAAEQPVHLLSLTLIEPVAFHLLRAEHGLFMQVVQLAATVSNAVARGDDRAGMEWFVDYWNGAGRWMRMKPELQNALAQRSAKVALDFAAIMNEATPIEALRRITCSTLLLCGSASPSPTRRLTEILAEALPQARLRTIAGAGHMLPLTHREAVNAVITEHLFRSMTDRQRPAVA